jgi:hypothetical protein
MSKKAQKPAKCDAVAQHLSRFKVPFNGCGSGLTTILSGSSNLAIFLILIEDKQNKLFDLLNITRTSGIRPHRISGRISSRSIKYPAGYQK